MFHITNKVGKNRDIYEIGKGSKCPKCKWGMLVLVILNSGSSANQNQIHLEKLQCCWCGWTYIKDNKTHGNQTNSSIPEEA